MAFLIAVICLLVVNCHGIGTRKGPVDANIGLDLVYYHMRKAGGTSILHTLGKWMDNQGCCEPVGCSGSIGFDGVNSGRQFHHNHSIYDHGLCPKITIVHSEFNCMPAKQILRSTATISDRRSNLRLLTMLRHPIARVISQAFYQGFGQQVTRQTILEMCAVDVVNIMVCSARCKETPDGSVGVHNNGVMLKLECACFLNAEKKALASVRGDESGWLKWMEAMAFTDAYMQNYYVKRLSAGDREGRYRLSPDSTVSPALSYDLFVNDLPPYPNRTRKDTPICRDNYDLLKSLFAMPCVRFQAIDRVALENAKLLLKDHFTVLILEYFGDKASHALLHDSLGGVAVDESFEKANGGIVGNTSSSSSEGLRDVLNVKIFALQHMPPSIYAKLEVDNALDIELFAFAVELYKERAKRLAVQL